MKEEIQTHYIFLDTSIFIKENFFAGNKLKAFLKHEKESEIELFTTEITLNECISNLQEFSHNSYSILKKTIKELNTKAKVFKNIISLNDIFILHETFEYKNEIDKLVIQFQNQIKNHFQNINIDSGKSTKIIRDYFDFKPPFKAGKKKFEFPDAFVLNSLESWCKKKKVKLYVVSDDEDMNSYESDYLLPIKEYDKLLDQISFTFSDENISIKIDEILEDKLSDIIAAVEIKFEDEFPYGGYDNSQGFEYEVLDLENFEAYILDHYVLSIYDNIATVELSVPVEYSVEISYEDTDSGWYDKEDGSWYGTDIIKKVISDDTTLTVIVEVEVELPGKNVMWENWELKEISSGMPDNIDIE